MAYGQNAPSCGPLSGHNWVFSIHRPYDTVTLNSTFTIVNNLKLFSIRVKESLEPIVLPGKATGFYSF